MDTDSLLLALAEQGLEGPGDEARKENVPVNTTQGAPPTTPKPGIIARHTNKSDPGYTTPHSDSRISSLGQLAKSRDESTRPPSSHARPVGFAEAGQALQVQRLTGLRMKNPLVSSSQLTCRFTDMAVLRLSEIRARYCSTGLSGSWATVCILGERSQAHQSSSGSTYSIWKVTDLDQTSVSLFLFGAAHDELWKQAPGTLVALLSPRIRNERDLTLTAMQAEQIWILGVSMDFGYCKALTKAGQPCRVPVNRSKCSYCPFHVQSEYNRLKSSARNEFQGSTLHTAFRAGQKKGLHWQLGVFDTTARAKQKMTGVPTAQLAAAAAAAGGRGSTAGSKYLNSIADPAAAMAATLERRQRERAHLGGGQIGDVLPRGRTTASLVPSALSSNAQSADQRTTTRKRKAGGAWVDLGDDDAAVTVSGGGDNVDNGARARALALLQSCQTDNVPKPKVVPEFLASAFYATEQHARKSQAVIDGHDLDGACGAMARNEQQQQRTKSASITGQQHLSSNKLLHHKHPINTSSKLLGSTKAPSTQPPPSALAAAFGDVVNESQAENQGSRYADLVRDEDDARLDGVLEVLERKDAMATQMDATKKLQVQAFRCRICQYTAERRRPECGAHPQAVERVNATKRWWECEHCHYRLATVGVKYPTKRCVKCNHPENGFISVSQWRPGKQPETDSVAGRRKLVTRGIEQKWVNQ